MFKNETLELYSLLSLVNKLFITFLLCKVIFLYLFINTEAKNTV